MSHPLRHGACVFVDPWHSQLLLIVWQWNCHHLFKRVLSQPGFEPSTTTCEALPTVTPWWLFHTKVARTDEWMNEWIIISHEQVAEDIMFLTRPSVSLSCLFSFSVTPLKPSNWGEYFSVYSALFRLPTESRDMGLTTRPIITSQTCPPENQCHFVFILACRDWSTFSQPDTDIRLPEYIPVSACWRVTSPSSLC